MKRIVALLLALVLCLGLFAGCGDKTTASEAPASAPAEESVAAAPETEPDPVPEEAPVEEVSVVEEEPEWEYVPISYPLADTPASLSYWIIWELSPDTIYNDITEHVVLSMLEEATGVHLDIKAQSQAAGQTNTDLMIASGDYPDLIANLSYSTGMDAAIEDEVVMNIKEDIPTMAPDYYRYLIEDDEYLWQNVQTDEGNIGAFVTVGTVSEVSDGMMVFEFMLDELGYESVEELKTIAQYEEFLTKAKDKYGMSSPLYLPGDFMLDGDSICSAFGVALKIDAISGDLPWIVENDEVKFGYLEQGFTDYVTLMNSWYEKGLIDSDTASHPTEYKNEDMIGLIANKQLALFNRGSGLVDLFKNISGEAVVPAYAPVVNEGDQLHIGGPVSSVSGESGLVITTGCEEYELAMNFCNYLYTDDYYIPSNYGVEDVTYTMVDGKPQFTEMTYSTPGRTFSSVMMDYQLITMVDANVVTPGMSEAAQSCNVIWSSNLDGNNDYPAAAAMNLDESDAYTQKAGDIMTLCQQYTAKFITGEIPLEEIPEFQEMLRTTGIQNCIDAKQSAYDRYMQRG